MELEFGEAGFVPRRVPSPRALIDWHVTLGKD
jgi:hypothetical protein